MKIWRSMAREAITTECLKPGRRGAGRGMARLIMAAEGGGAGKRRRWWIGGRRGEVAGAGRDVGQREDSWPQAQQLMQRGGSRQAERRRSLLRQRKQRPRKRLKKASRSGLGRGERGPERGGESCRGMGRCRSERGEEPRKRSRLGDTKIQGFQGEIVSELGEGREPTTTDFRRERAVRAGECRVSADRAGARRGPWRRRATRGPSSSRVRGEHRTGRSDVVLQGQGRARRSGRRTGGSGGARGRAGAGGHGGGGAGTGVDPGKERWPPRPEWPEALGGGSYLLSSRSLRPRPSRKQLTPSLYADTLFISFFARY